MKLAQGTWHGTAYINPDFNEILELVASRWDTCRILIHEKTNEMVIGSGYGNDHNSLSIRYWEYKGKRRQVLDPFILFRTFNGEALMNLEDISGSRNARYDEWSKHFGELHLDMLKDLIRESGLAL